MKLGRKVDLNFVKATKNTMINFSNDRLGPYMVQKITPAAQIFFFYEYYRSLFMDIPLILSS